MREGKTGARVARVAQAVARHLDPSKPGRRERELLAKLIADHIGQYDDAHVIIGALTKRGKPLELEDEPDFLRSLPPHASTSLAATLQAIDAYEQLCRPLLDTFNWAWYLATQSPHEGVTEQGFLKQAPADDLASRLKKAIDTAARNDVLAEVWDDRSDVLDALQDGTKAAGLLPAVIAHHRKTQRQKPPDGKRAWLEESRGRFLVRLDYRWQIRPAQNAPYVHNYRCPTLSSFLDDLGAFAA
jgi:hypothetical protein